MVVELKRVKTKSDDGKREFTNWELTLPTNEKVLIKPVFPNGIESLLVAYLQEEGK